MRDGFSSDKNIGMERYMLRTFSVYQQQYIRGQDLYVQVATRGEKLELLSFSG